jgi:pimeloyl-ACP methyl ester carboxylesterase
MGLFVRLYASTYPEEVAALVLVDVPSDSLAEKITPEQWVAYKNLFQPVPPELASYRNLEFADLDASIAEIREAAAASPLPSAPSVVLSRGQAMPLPADLPGGLSGEMLERAWQQGQADLAALLPDARHVIATESEHYLQLQQPELVIDAVRDGGAVAK